MKQTKLIKQTVLPFALACTALTFNPLCGTMTAAASTSAMQQAGAVNGVVVDANGEPIIGASVKIVGTSNGSVTDFDGNFKIANVQRGATLEISYIGFVTQRVKVTGQALKVVLQEDSKALEEVVVVGYGVQRKSDVTGALSHVGSKELESRPVNNAFEALQGKAAGVDITTSERPGTVGDIRIRGERSLSASNTPLYVVDGVPLMSGSGIETLNPRDIESIDILKDASATAIYGSRGANGVVIVTTKSGKAGQFSLNYSGSVTFQDIVDRNENVSAADYVNYRRWAAYNSDPTKYADPRTGNSRANDEAIFGILDDPTAVANILSAWDGGTWDPSRIQEYDWLGQAVRTGFIHEHTLSASGGSDKLNAFGSFGYLSNRGTQKGQEYQRYTARMGVNINPVDWMTINMSINASREEQDYGMSNSYAPSSTNSASGIYNLYKKSYSWAQPYDADGNRIKYPGGDNQSYNPINEWEHNISNRETYRMLGSFAATLHLGKLFAPLKGLDYKITFGPDYRHYRQGDYIDTESAYKWMSGGKNQARWQQRRDFSWTLDNMITYNNTFAKKHNVGVTLLQSASKWNYETASMELSGLEQDMYKWNAMGSLDITDSTNGAKMSTGINDRQLESYMVRINYGFDERYLLTASARWDGASQLSKGRKWAFFPSVSLGWRIQQESFLRDVNWLSNLKIRAGVGTTGNSAIDPYSTLGLIQSIFVPTATGQDKAYLMNDPAYVKNTLVMANTEVGWEKTTQWNFGIDFGFLRNRISGSLEFYFSKTKDLLLNMSIPSVLGYSSTMANIGKTSNKGIELTLNAIPVETKDFVWNSSLNLSWQKDKIDELANGKEDDVNNKWFIGEQLSVYYGYTADGLWQDTPEDRAEMEKWNANGENFSPGKVRPHDVDGDYKMTDADRVIIGNRRPNVTAGWTNSFTYKGIELSCQLYGRFGYWAQRPVQSLFGYGNLGECVDYWTPDNTGASYQKPILTTVQTGDADSYSGALTYKKANFIRMRNIAIGYQFPKNLVKSFAQNLKVYAQVINPFDLKQSIDGLDLDTNQQYYNRSWVVGLEIGF